MVDDPSDASRATRAILRGDADLVSFFGRAFVATPDFVERVRRKAALNDLNTETLYFGDGAAGYTDYPALLG
jgi:N-ethylmaleimide reductase